MTITKEWADGDDSDLYAEGYRSGVWWAVALINEQEDLTLHWRDVLEALTAWDALGAVND